ncbi:MAG: PAS domain S-box protein [Candidatus Omnitrophica bacterium]|nr:PAS domain S-box protein [Candidatus Omnitrophota bacterium]
MKMDNENNSNILLKQIEFILGVTKTGLDIIDSNYNIRYIDPEWAKVYGDFKNKKCYEYFVDRNQVCEHCGIRKALETKSTVIAEEVLIKENNRPIQVTTIPFQAENGEWLVAEVNVDIAERKKTEQEVKASEEKFRTIFDNATDGIILVEIESKKFYMCNKVFLQMLGYSLEEIKALGVNDIHPESDLPFVIQEFEKQARGESILAKDIPVKRKDGSIFYADINSSPVVISGKKYLVGFFRDITLNRQFEAKLKESERRFRDTLENLNLSAVQLDVEGRVIFCNDAFLKLSGWKKEEIFGRNGFDVFLPVESRERVKSVFSKVLSGEDPLPLHYEVYIQTRDQGQRLVLWNNSLLRDPNGKILGISSIGEDITERKLMEAEREGMLKWQEEVNALRQSLIAPGELAIKLKIITDSIVRIFNADFCRIWLIRPGDKCEQGCVHAKIKEGPHVCRFREKCLHLMASSGRYTHIDGKDHGRVPFGCYKIGRVASGEDHKFITNDVVNDSRVHNHEWARELGLVSFVGYQLRVPDGEILGVLALFAKHKILPPEDAILDSLSTTTAFIIQQCNVEDDRKRAVDELKKAYSKLKEAQSQLIQAEKMHVVGTLAGGVAHEIKNPLAIILQGVNFLERKKLFTKPEQREVLGMIKEAVGRADGIVKGLLDFSRPSRLEFKFFQLPEIVEESIGFVSKQMALKNVKIVKNFTAVKNQVRVDRNQIEQVFVNIIINALQAMPQGGSITINIYNKSFPELKSIIGYQDERFLNPTSQAVVIEVIDSGQGIPKHILDKVFDPFFTTKPPGEGAGLGLSISRTIMENHRGDIYMESHEGKGTKVIVILPVIEEGNK